MKTLYLYMKFIMSCTFLAGTLHAAPAIDDADKIMKAIDNICGDSWCEGDFGFHFQKVILKPTKNETQILFRMSQEYPVRLETPVDQEFKAQINRRFYDVSCIVPGYSSYDTIMKSEFSLHNGFYSILTDCIRSLEHQLALVNKIP